MHQQLQQVEPYRRRASRLALLALGASLASLSACSPGGRDVRATGDSARDGAMSATGDTSSATTAAVAPMQAQLPQTPPADSDTNRRPGNGATTPRRTTRLTPLADTIAQRLVFAPLVQDWFTAASRTKRLVVDLGRFDIDLKKDAGRLAAFREAARALSPFPVGMRLRLRGPWGSEDATIRDFEAYNGRIVATLASSPLVDSLAAVTDPLVASAQRVGAERAPEAGACDRSVDSAFVARLKLLARETEDSLRASEDQPIYKRLQGSIKARRSVAQGCFGAARGLVIVTLYAGDYEWVRERVLLVGEGTPREAKIRDLRFRAHEALHALDADGDGVDDLAARAWTPRGGGTAILTFNPTTSRFERLAQGFAWER